MHDQHNNGLTKNAIILLSGGLDSATCLAIARNEGYQCYGLSFDYGQRHKVEISFAENLARIAKLEAHKIIPIDMTGIGGSALTDMKLKVPKHGSEGIPITYVPARNTVFLSYALAWAEVLQAEAIFIGVNSMDYSGYPDCRIEFIEAFQAMANLATKAGVEGNVLRIETPLINLSKAEIIQKGDSLGVDFSLTVSCYQADSEGKACGRCESCHFRSKGFQESGIVDPTVYQ